MSFSRVCALTQLTPGRAVAALVHGAQVAVVRVAADEVYAVGHHDPFSGANVMARGIVGSTTVDGEPVPTIASPMFKQAFDLRTGVCLSDRTISLGSWPVRVVDGQVEIGPAREVPRTTDEEAS